MTQVQGGEAVVESAAVQMCARKISAVAGDARAAIDVCRRAVEAVEADCRRQLRFDSAAGQCSELFLHLLAACCQLLVHELGQYKYL